MLRHAIVGYDGSDRAHDALALGEVLTERAGAELTVARVLQWDAGAFAGGGTPSGQALALELDARVRADLDAAARRARGRARTVVSASSARGLHDLASDTEADLLVVGSSGRGQAGRVLAGGVANRLLNGAPCAVAVAPLGYRRRYAPDVRVIGVGYDGSPEAQAALEAAADVARQLGASLRLVAVAPAPDSAGVPPWPPLMDARQLGRRLRHDLEGRIDAALATLPAELGATGSVISGAPATVLLDKAGLGFDLLALGSRGYGTLRRVLLGSVSSDLVSAAPCPVVVFPRSVVIELADGEPADRTAA
jgi:nucleotide-binding universal stress UspA family protein